MSLTVEGQSQPYQPAVDDVSEGTARRQGVSGGALGKRRRVYLTLAQNRAPGKDGLTPCHAICRPIVSHKDILTSSTAECLHA